MTIKMRMTLWYSALMLILAVAVLGFMVFISDSVAAGSAKDSLIRTVDANMDEVEYEDGAIDVDEDFVYLTGGVSCVVYIADGTLAAGYLPGGFATEAALEDGGVRTVLSGGQSYFIYDRLADSRDGELWVRGIVVADGSTGIMGAVMTAAFILLPFIVLVAAVVGYQIARWSFKPVDTIIRAANEIGEGSDLTKRIQLGEGRDEIHRLAETFDSMFARLEASFEEERRLTSDVSHELRTPTAVILSQCEYALAHAETEEDYREAMVTIERQGKRMSRMISQLLSFTRLEQGVERAVYENTNLSELVQTVCEEQEHGREKNITILVEAGSDIYAEVDQAMMVRLLTNLLSNACQYGRQNGHVWVRLWRQDGELYLSVQDDGIGIPAESLDKIWNRFYQVDPSRTSSESGSMGLGLAMAHQIARLHGGRIEVQSTLGAGSAFTFIFPGGGMAE